MEIEHPDRKQHYHQGFEKQNLNVNVDIYPRLQSGLKTKMAAGNVKPLQSNQIQTPKHGNNDTNIQFREH